MCMHRFIWLVIAFCDWPWHLLAECARAAETGCFKGGAMLQ